MNEFEVGSYIEWLEASKSHINVVLWIAINRSNCVCIDTDRKNKRANPVRLSVADIELALACGKAKIVPFNTVPDNLSVLQDPHFQTYLDHRDQAWAIIEPLVQNLQIFDPRSRGKLISARAKETKVTAKVILKYLRRYWQTGQKKNALLPQYDKCGGSRKIRRSTDSVKRGRPSELKVKLGIETGKNADEEVRRKFRTGIALYYENKSGATLRKAYDDTIRWLFNLRVDIIDGVDYPILPAAQERPQFEQFRYWYYRERRLSRSIILRQGENEFNLNHRALGNDTTLDAFGPASIFELDSTVADNYVVSALDRNRILGRPILYFIKDVFSRLIVGMSVSLNGPSWETAMLAVENMMVDKVAFCREFGIYIAPWQWPSHHLPRAIRADRGEFLSKNSDTLVNILDIQIDTTAPYRPDWKGIIEQNFKLMNDMTIHWLPGQPNKVRKRGGKDYRYDACLTLYEFRQIIISSVIEYNTSKWLDNYRKDEYMIADHVSPIPIKLWEWGIQNRSGILRTEEREKVRLALLPRDYASITPTGIHFKGADYSCGRAKGEEWYEKARQKRVRIPISYDTRNMDTIILRLDEMDPSTFHFLSPNGEKNIEAASLMKKELRFSGCDWQDVDDYFAVERQAKLLDETESSQQQSNQKTLRENIIKQAKEKTNEARRGKNNTSRVKGMTATKRLENNAEGIAGAWTPSTSSSAPSSTPPLSQDDRYKQEEYEWLEHMRDGETNGH
jgi:hypothetical protein